MCSAEFALVLVVVDKGKATVFLDQAEVWEFVRNSQQRSWGFEPYLSLYVCG